MVHSLNFFALEILLKKFNEEQWGSHGGGFLEYTWEVSLPSFPYFFLWGRVGRTSFLGDIPSEMIQITPARLGQMAQKRKKI